MSKNQAPQILYLKPQIINAPRLLSMLKHIKLHKLPWIEIHKILIPTKLNSDTVQFHCYITIVNKSIPYNSPASSLQVLSSICVI